VHPAMLAAHRRRLFRWVVAAESLLAMLMLGASAVVSESHPIVAAILLTLAIVTIASLAVIEPATTGGAGLDATSERKTLPPPQ